MKRFAFAMTGCLAICIALLGSQTVGSPLQVFIDVGSAESSPGAKWNTIDAGDVGSGVELHDAGGTLTGVTATLANGSGCNWQTSAATGQIGAYAGTILADATGDYLYIRNTASAPWTCTLALAGLDDSKLYQLEMSASRGPSNWPKGQFVTLGGDYAVGWNSTTPFNAQSDGHDSGKILLWEEVSPTGGELLLTVTRSGGDAFLNALVLTEVPEPAACMLLAIGLGCLAFRRRRRSV